MNDWFEWNNKRCTELGIHVLEQPSYTMPVERVTFSEVPGRSGSLTTVEGTDVYEDMVLTATCMIDSESRIPAICSWLRGGGNVTFANRPDGFYKARITNQIAFDKILRGNPHRRFAVNFRCQPFRYLKDSPTVTLQQTPATVTNPGNVASEPVITVYGSGDITLMVGATIVELTGVSGNVTIDSEVMECYKGTAGRNSKMNGDFPLLEPGLNGISWDGNVTKVVVKLNWRTL